jgi:AcrR family transcriptional regulator
VLATAAERASTEGLEGVTIGHLASLLAMSKSGVVELFGSKANLQAATVQSASERFQREVIDAVTAEPGLGRLSELLDRWLEHVATAYPGGCFFAAAATELDGRPGPARDLLETIERRWIGLLESEARLAVRLRELPASTDPAQLAFELFGLLLAANFWNQLLGEASGLQLARQAIAARLAPLVPGQPV